MKKKSLGIVIGRFQILHNEHVKLIQQAIKENDEVIVLVGSYLSSPSMRNPFHFSDRQIMIESVFDDINIQPIVDYLYDIDIWVSTVKEVVYTFYNKKAYKFNLYGHEKDYSSFYLSLFPEWNFKPFELTHNIHSSKLRNIYFNEGIDNYIQKNVPESVFNFLNQFQKGKEYNELKNMFEFNQNYKKLWLNTPYPVTFPCVGVMYKWNNEILLIKRNEMPNKGLLALVGGFFDGNTDISLVSSAQRKFLEETNCEFLVEDIVFQKNYDSIHRSDRGRLITTLFVVDVSYLQYKPEIKMIENNEIKKTLWMSVHDIKNNCYRFHDDHFSIIFNVLRERYNFFKRGL